MSSLIDLLPLGEEVRCCTALGILVQSDPGLLPELLARIRPLDGNGRRLTPWSPADQEQGVESLTVSVEEEISVEKEARRLDLVFRFHLKGQPCAVVVEAKVGAASEHGAQIAAYESCLRAWHQKGRQVLGVLLTAAPLEQFEWKSDRDKLEHFNAHLSWKDVCEVLSTRIKNQDRERCLFARLGSDLVENLEDWIMGLEELHNRLATPSPHCYPVLIDALEMVARQASGEERVHKDPPGGEGAPWDEQEQAYWCGYWWRVGPNWAGVYLRWEYNQTPVDPTDELTWVPEGEATGYAASVRLLFGSEDEQDGHAIQSWSLESFGEQLTTLPEQITRRASAHAAH